MANLKWHFGLAIIFSQLCKNTINYLIVFYNYILIFYQESDIIRFGGMLHEKPTGFVPRINKSN